MGFPAATVLLTAVRGGQSILHNEYWVAGVHGRTRFVHETHRWTASLQLPDWDSHCGADGVFDLREVRWLTWACLGFRAGSW